MFKYYSYNLIDLRCDVVGSRVLRVWFYKSPIDAMNMAVKITPENKYIIDFKRIK